MCLQDGRWWGRSHPKKRAIDTWRLTRLIKQPCLNGRYKRQRAHQKQKQKKKKRPKKKKKKTSGFSISGRYQYKTKRSSLDFPIPAAWTFITAVGPPTCAICLHDIHRAAIGPDAPYDWPACSHPIHLRCAMQHVSHQADPACPTCRQQWTQEGQQRLEQLNQTHQVPWVVPETPRDTRSVDTQPPPAPDQPLLLCCPRLALIDHHHPERDTSWRELPARHMDWAPTLNRTTNEWQPEWVCLRCNTAVTPNDFTIDAAEPSPVCPFHGPRRLAIDLRHNERGWVCSRGSPPHILQCEPTRVNTPAPPSTHPTPALRQWERQGPPRDGQAIPHANSWFYVPLLLAGANHLHPEAAQEWQAHPQAGPEWHNLVTQLRQAPAIPWQRLHHTLQTLQQLARDTNHQLPAAETALVEQLVTAGSREPAGAQIHLPWAMRIVTQPTGYVPATAQETLLQNFPGERQAAYAATVADRWRQPRPAPPTDYPPTPPAAEARPTHMSGPEVQHPSEPPASPTNSSSSTNSSTSSTDSTSSSTPIARAPTPPATERPPSQPEAASPDERRLQAALAALDEIDLFATLQHKCFFFQTPAQLIRGRVRQALSFALHSINTASSEQGQSRAWKLWLLLPRMLLHRPPGVRTLSKDDWHARIDHFQHGQWIHLLSTAHHQARAATTTSSPASTPERQASRARQLVHLGELSAARQALTAGPLAPGTANTLQELQDPARRPNAPYAPLHPSLSEFQPDQPVDLPDDLILTNLRKARKGAAPGPSGLTADTLRILLDDDTATSNLIRVARKLAQAGIPAAVAQAIGLGRMVALTKPNGRVRGIVVGDVLRRLVSRCLAQQYAQPIHTACQPHQFALATRSGTEAVVHALTAVTEANPTHTILSVDGIGAYDNISRNSMLQGLRDVPAANCCLPFVNMFYGAPSHYIWHSATGEAHIISQAEGGEQGDPLMPALFSLGQRSALQTIQEHLLPNESLLAFLDDVYVVVPPHRVRPVYDVLAHTLHSQARIQLNRGKTRVWNAAGIEPPNVQELGEDVWVGNQHLPDTSQGITVLGAPIGSGAFVQNQLRQANQQHQHLLDRIPHLEDLQASWLLLLFCASPRCTYLLRMCPPHITAEFANNHDFAVAACLRRLLAVDELPATALATAHLPLSHGGLGLTCAATLANPAFWSSWADSLPVLQNQLPQYAAQLLAHLQQPSPAIPSIQAATGAAQALQEHGWTPPSWAELTQGIYPDPAATNTEEEAPRTRGWQQQATIPVHTAMYNELQAAIPPASQALLQSQAGPFASRAFTTIPYSTEFEYPSHLFRILLLRRLRLHLPLSARSCRCRRPLDPLGDHRAACAQSGVLRARGGPLERAAARICREGGARVTTNTRLADLNIHNLSRVDDRRIEVIANGLPMWGGSQLAVDTTLVSPLTRSGEPRSRGGTYAGAALQDARRNKERTYPELLHNRRCRLVVLGIEVGGRWSNEASSFIRMLAKARARPSPPSLQAATTSALVSRWSALLTHAAATSFAASLLFEDLSLHHNLDGDLPPIGHLLSLTSPAVPSSRLPAR